MKTLIDVNRVFSLAFGSEEGYVASVITEVDIVEAETRFLRPVLGDALYDALSRGAYAQLMDEYVAPMLALWTRFVVEPSLAMRCCGCMSRGAISEARNDYDRRAYRALQMRAAAYSRRLTDYLNANGNSFPEYDAKSNFLNRCSFYGNII
jgi:hypothetical protein